VRPERLYPAPMPDLDRRPAHRLTQAQAADLLGVSTARVAELVAEGRLTPVAKWAKAGLLRADVERRTLERWRPGDPTWLTTAEVAAVLGVTGPRVSQHARRGFLPYERTPGGRRVFRPAQVEVIARARRERFHTERDG